MFRGAFSDFRRRLQHIHPEGPLKKMGPLSGMVRSLRRGLNRATLGILVIDEDRCPCVKLLPDLEDFCRQRNVLDAVVGPFAAALPRCCYFLVTLCLSQGEEIL